MSSVPAGDAADLTARLERIKHLTHELVHSQADSTAARELAVRIERELAAARNSLKIVDSR